MTDPTQAQSQVDPAQTATIAGQTGASPTNPPADTGAASAQAAAPASRPTWIPEPFWDAQKSAPKEKEFSEHLASLEKLKADTEAKRGAIPAKPEDYKADLGEIKLPPGRELDTKDQRFLALQKVAHEEALPASTFNKILRIEADYVNYVMGQVEAGREKFLNMLGENSAARIQSLNAFIDGHWTKPEEANQMRAMVVTPVIVKHLETYQKMVTSQGAHGFVQSGREPAPTDNKPEGWEKLSAVDRRTWQLQENRRKAS